MKFITAININNTSYSSARSIFSFWRVVQTPAQWIPLENIHKNEIWPSDVIFIPSSKKICIMPGFWLKKSTIFNINTFGDNGRNRCVLESIFIASCHRPINVFVCKLMFLNALGHSCSTDIQLLCSWGEKVVECGQNFSEF